MGAYREEEEDGRKTRRLPRRGAERSPCRRRGRGRGSQRRGGPGAGPARWTRG